MRTATPATDVMMPIRGMFSVMPEQVGAFQVETREESVRLVMREPHFANNVRYSLVVGRSTKGDLTAHWNDSEDERPCSWLEVGLA